ncbi:hypothetical protein BGX38DRAFT_623794 [Terfezia claveryi]|nr:hypothetical protein BGX38DRAFT_623794 [Terfezia claveryi]
MNHIKTHLFAAIHLFTSIYSSLRDNLTSLIRIILQWTFGSHCCLYLPPLSLKPALLGPATPASLLDPSAISLGIPASSSPKPTPCPCQLHWQNRLRNIPFILISPSTPLVTSFPFPLFSLGISPPPSGPSPRPSSSLSIVHLVASTIVLIPPTTDSRSPAVEARFSTGAPAIMLTFRVVPPSIRTGRPLSALYTTPVGSTASVGIVSAALVKLKMMRFW